MRRLLEASVLIVGLSAINVEASKDLALAGKELMMLLLLLVAAACSASSTIGFGLPNLLNKRG